MRWTRVLLGPKARQRWHLSSARWRVTWAPWARASAVEPILPMMSGKRWSAFAIICWMAVIVSSWCGWSCPVTHELTVSSGRRQLLGGNLLAVGPLRPGQPRSLALRQPAPHASAVLRSEERRVGQEGRYG